MSELEVTHLICSQLREAFIRAQCHLVHQGSVSSPGLFNVVMDPLLAKLKMMNLGINANGLRGGGS